MNISSQSGAAKDAARLSGKEIAGNEDETVRSMRRACTAHLRDDESNGAAPNMRGKEKIPCPT
jgi:hypothetical protein